MFYRVCADAVRVVLSEGIGCPLSTKLEPTLAQQCEQERGDGEGAPIHMPMIRLETVENHTRLWSSSRVSDTCPCSLHTPGN